MENGSLAIEDTEEIGDMELSSEINKRVFKTYQLVGHRLTLISIRVANYW